MVLEPRMDPELQKIIFKIIFEEIQTYPKVLWKDLKKYFPVGHLSRSKVPPYVVPYVFKPD
jgi:hypothetical protein